jgi:Fe-S cluster assembly protein SufD
MAEVISSISVPNDALSAVRKQAFDHFERRGLPKKEDEAFRYFPVRSFRDVPLVLAGSAGAAAIESYILPECKENYIVFIDGHFDPALSRMGIKALPMHEAMRTYGHFLRTRFSKALDAEADPFALFNLAFHPAGAFLYLPPKAVLGPMQVLFFSTQTKSTVLPRLHIFAGAYSTAKIIVTNLDAKETLSFPAIDIALEEGANVRLEQVAEANALAWNLFSLRATLKKDSRFSHLQWNKGKGVVRSDIRVWLQGEGAETDLQGVWMLKDKAQAHAQVRVDHEAPHCQSMQKFKGVLSDLSQSSFEGKIYVQPEAQKTQAYQLNKNLLLSPHVIAHAKPNLEIFADDVKASHGATVAHLDDELLFYLKSRGISEAQAKSLLVEGFCREVLDNFSLPSLGALHAVRTYLS